MKQIKFLAMALVLLMGVSFTSCLDNDTNPIQEMQMVVRYSGGMYGSYFETPDGLKLIPTDPTSMMTLTPGLYSVYFEFNTEEEAGKKEITITLKGTPARIPDLTCDPAEQAHLEANRPMAYLEYNVGYGGKITPVFYDKNTMLFPVLFWSISVKDEKAWQEELAKHQFEITYSVNKAESMMILHVAHRVNDVNVDPAKPITRKTLQTTNFALNIRNAVANAKNEIGGKIKKIKVVGKCNATSEDLSKASDSELYIDCSQLDI